MTASMSAPEAPRSFEFLSWHRVQNLIQSLLGNKDHRELIILIWRMLMDISGRESYTADAMKFSTDNLGMEFLKYAKTSI